METAKRLMVVRGSEEGKERRKGKTRRKGDRAQGMFKAVKLLFYVTL